MLSDQHMTNYINCNCPCLQHFPDSISHFGTWKTYCSSPNPLNAPSAVPVGTGVPFQSVAERLDLSNLKIAAALRPRLKQRYCQTNVSSVQGNCCCPLSMGREVPAPRRCGSLFCRHAATEFAGNSHSEGVTLLQLGRGLEHVQSQ
jgi:hypothetical protein